MRKSTQFPASGWLAISLLPLLLLSGPSPILAQGATAPTGSANESPTFPAQPNGRFTTTVVDMSIKVGNGYVRMKRDYNGSAWQFNANWETLIVQYDNIGGGGNSSGGGGGGGGGTAPSPPPPEVFGGSLVSGLLSQEVVYFPQPASGPVIWLTRNGAPFQADGDYGSFIQEGGNGRYVIKPLVKLGNPPGLPPKAIYQGSVGYGPIYRWQDRSGDWIDYDRYGGIIKYGNANGLIATFVREEVRLPASIKPTSRIKAVKDRDGNTVMELIYNRAVPIFLDEVRDLPLPGENRPVRVVKYEYEGFNLTKVTDVRGYVTRYEYSSSNLLRAITDAEGRTRSISTDSKARMTSETAPDGGVTDYVYDYDRIKKEFYVRITHPETTSGRKVESRWYDAEGQLLRIENNGKLAYDFKQNGREVSTINSLGYPVKSTRNEYEQIVRTTYPDQSATSQTYSAVHLRMTKDVDEEGTVTEYQYDEKGNLLQKTEAAKTPAERITVYRNNADGQPIEITQKGRVEINGFVTQDAVWQFEYDQRGHLKKSIDPEGYPRLYTYRSDGALLSYTNARQHTTTFEVDEAGHLTKIIDPMSQTRSFGYDKVGNVIKITDERAKSIQFVYDKMNRVEKVINAVNGEKRTLYDKAGSLFSRTDGDGHKTDWEFDNFQRLTKVMDGLGNTAELDYKTPISDSAMAGVVESPYEIKYPTYTSKLGYDTRERITRNTAIHQNIRGTEELASGTRYNRRGDVISVTDEDGKSSSNTYDELGRRVETTDRLNHKTKIDYDVRGNVIQVTDANQHVTRFEYDRNNRMIKEVLHLGQTIHYGYDEAGNLKQKTDPNGHKAVFDYDKNNRVLEVKRYALGNQLVRTTNYTWDGAGNLQAWRDVDHNRNQVMSSAAIFDDANRKTSETITYPGGNTLSYGYGYSLANYKTRLTWPDGTEIGYSYSAHGALESVTIPGEGIISVNQFKWIMPEKVTLPGGVTQERSFDGMLKLEGLQSKDPTQKPLLSLVNQYSKKQELKQSTRIDTLAGSATTKDSRYNYDDEIRLTQVVTETSGVAGKDTETFTLDAVANRTVHSKVDGTWRYDENNRLKQLGVGDGATLYDYDESGNRIKMTERGNRVTQYGYDTQNRLVEVKDGNNRMIARYGYGPLGHRLWKEQFRDKEGNELAQANRTYYLYANEGLIAQSSQDIVLNGDQAVPVNGGPRITVQYGPQPDAMFTAGHLFVKTKNSNGQDMFAYYHNDHLGTPIQATDKAGNVVWAARYNAFGSATIVTPAASVGRPTIESSLRLPGQIEDAETGLHYNFHRQYDPGTGRYLTSDPIGLNGGVNSYGYVLGNPVMNTDPKGLLTQCSSGLATTYGFRFGPLQHEFSCFKNEAGATICRGLGRDPKGEAWDAMANSTDSVILKNEENFATAKDKFQDNKCTPDDENKCMDKCVGDFYAGLEAAKPSYSWRRNKGEECQRVNRSIVQSCMAQCHVEPEPEPEHGNAM